MKESLRRVFSIFLCTILIMTCLPSSVRAASASSDHVDLITDTSTMDGWQDLFLPDGKISTENAGKIWMDNSMFEDNSEFSHLGITMDSTNGMLIALSAMATSMSVTGMSHVPTDTMLILDVSASMGPSQNNVASELIEAANTSIASLLATNAHSRVGVVLYSGPTTTGGSASATDAVVILPLGRYETVNDIYLNYINNNVSLNDNVVIENTNNEPVTTNKAITGGTYIQKGVMLAADQLTADGLDTTLNDPVLGTIQRKPVMVLMSDGAPTFSSTNFQDPTSINLGNGTATSAAQGFVNQLTASYAKSIVEEKYGTSALFYTIGLGVSNNSIALSVLDPDNQNASTAVNDFWHDEYRWGNNTYVTGYLHLQTGETMSVGNNRSVTKIERELEQNYVDEFINVTDDSSQGSLGDRLKEAFSAIVSKINLQSQYAPTLVSQVGADHSGFISFVNRVGEYMSVVDIKGIIINDRLYSGTDLASNFVTGGGNLGTYDNPTELGHEMVAAVRQRIGLANDDEARTLIGLAYEYGQIRYSSANDYSNYIGWYADEDSNFLGFYQEGVTNITDPDAVYTIKSYGYLGVEHDSNMMYATVQVRKNIQTGQETVAFAIPASLIPVMTYNVSLDQNGNLSDITLSGADSPIRLVYEVALDNHINEWNVTEIVSSDYLTDVHNVNPDGTVNFYVNDWEHTNSTGYNTVNAYSYFNPSRQNDRYYYTSDAPVYVDTAGTLYQGNTKPDGSGTYYRAYTVYEKDGNVLNKKTVYREIPDVTLDTAENIDGTNNWAIPNGNVQVNLDGYTVEKEPDNATGTLDIAYQPFVDVYGHNVNDTNHLFYVGATLGNNGKLILTPQTGIKISKAMAADTAVTDEEFVFVLTKDIPSASDHDALLVDANGTEHDTAVSFDSNGEATVSLKAGQTIYIGDMTKDEVVYIYETEVSDYIPTVTVDGAASVNPATVTIKDNQLIEIDFVNAERGTGNLTIEKHIRHDLGNDYQIPADKVFTMEVTLSGTGIAGTFDAHHTNGSYSDITIGADGKFTVDLHHGEKFEVFGLPAGTVAVVRETTVLDGFTTTYYENGNLDDGTISVVKNNTASVVVVNTYAAEEVFPINLDLGGEKIVKDAEGNVVSVWDPSWEFTIVLERYDQDGWNEVDRITVEDSNKSFTFDMSQEEYDTPGVYSYQLYEIIPDIGSTDRVNGMIYDSVRHTFSVHVSDADMNGRLEITRVHSEHADSDFVLNDGKYTIKTDFVNVQTPTIPAVATIDIQKKLINDSNSPVVSLSGYNFGLYTDVACTQAVTTGNGIQNISYNPTDMIGEGWIDIQFNQLGDYTFYLKETAGSVNNMTYSPDIIKVVVNVAVHANNPNAFVATVSYFNTDDSVYTLNSDSEVEFTNIYEPVSTQLTIDFVKKQMIGRGFIPSDDFRFQLIETNVPQVVAPRILEGILDSDDDNDGIATVSFGTLTFDKVGTYSFEIKELGQDEKGITKDNTVYILLVTVTDINGQLNASYNIVNTTEDEIVFINRYHVADATYTISGTKELSGRTLLNDEFTFVLTEAQNAQGDIAANAATYEAYNEFGGIFSFPEMTYTEEGTWYYVVSEKQNSGSSYGIQYDTDEYIVTVTVTEDVTNGILVASADLDTDDIEFNNRYVANPVSKSIDGEKVLNGKTLVGGQFSFELWQSDAQWSYVDTDPIQTVTNDADGDFAFNFVDYTNNNASDFTKAGTYFYLIKEVNGGSTIKGITYDDVVYRVRVEVTDDLLGQLHATAHIYDNEGIPQDEILFTNDFIIIGDSDLTVDINIFKTVLNTGSSILSPAGFEFLLENITTHEIYHAYSDSSGNAKFTLGYSDNDIDETYTYKLTEVNDGKPHVTYSTSEYLITVSISLNANNELVATLTNNGTDVTMLFGEFENVYNYTPIQQYPDSPDTSDHTNLNLWISLLFLSGCGIIGTAIYDKKNRRQSH